MTSASGMNDFCFKFSKEELNLGKFNRNLGGVCFFLPLFTQQQILFGLKL